MTRADVVVLAGPRRLERRAITLPELGDDGILRIEACGLRSTVTDQYIGSTPAASALVPGHEIVGVVEQAAPSALERWDAHIGERVAVGAFLSCRSCNPCRTDDHRRCSRHGPVDRYGQIPVDEGPGLWGGCATHLYLAPDAMLVPVPERLDPTVATLFGPVGEGLRFGVDVASLTPGDVVVVLGPGIRGLAAAAAAKRGGAGIVMVTGHSATDIPHLQTAGAFGADLTVDVTVDDPRTVLESATGRLADVVIDVTAHTADAPDRALHLVRPGGTVVLASRRGADEGAPFDPDVIVEKEINVVGAVGVDAGTHTAALDLLAAETFPFADLPRSVVGFDDLEDLLRAMAGETDEPPFHAVFVPD